MAVETDAQRARDVAIAPTVMATGPLADPSDPSAPAQEQAPERERGALLGRYVVLDRLGVGGMGVVYAAFDPELDRKVAIKLLQQRGPGSMGPARLLREAKAMARLSHPGVITVHDVGIVDDQVFIAMELVEGGTLREWLAAAPRSWREVVNVFIQAGEGLAAAHEAGLVHRDFKPDNVLVGDDGRVRVLDFGLARATDEGGATQERRQPDDRPVDALASSLSSSTLLRSAGLEELDVSAAQLSRDGAIIGTPAYMAPEQHLGADVDARSDVFAFCVALWEALYAQHPYVADTRLNMIYALTRGEIRPPPSDRRVPRWLHALLLRGLRPEPRDRPQTMREVLAALRRGRRRRGQALWTVTVALLVVLSATATWAALRRDAAPSTCDGARERLAGIWDPQTQERIAAAFAASGVPYADATWTSIRGDLSGYADAWATMYRDACEATHVRGDQSTDLLDLRMACLSDHLAEFAALSELLAEADRGVVGQAKRAAAALPPLDRCAEVLALGVRDRLPDDVARRRQIDDVQARLGRLRARLNAGQIREALELLPKVAELAEAADYGPARAAAAHLRGQLLDRNGDAEAAQAALVDAALQAIASREDQLAADAMTDLIYTVGVRLARADDALLWSRLAAATIERLPPGAEREQLAARRLDREGLVLAQRGDLRGGKARQEEALAIAEANHGADSLEAAAIHLNLSATLADLGELGPAQAHLEGAIRTLAAELGADHPHVAVAINNLGALFDSLGAPEEAVVHHRKALAIKSRSLGEDHPSTANSHNNLAASLLRLGEVEEAATHLARAEAIKRAAFGDGSPLLAETLGLQAEVALRRGDAAAAATLAAEALTLVAGFDEGGTAGANPQAIPLHRVAALAAHRRGEPLARDEHFATAMAIHREVGGDAGHYVDLVLAYADVLDGAGERPRGRALVDAALAEETRGDLSYGRRGDELRAWLFDHKLAN
ncbi:MAG: serine/threonine-protein kinase [Nannocystaceae bacterium]